MILLTSGNIVTGRSQPLQGQKRAIAKIITDRSSRDWSGVCQREAKLYSSDGLVNRLSNKFQLPIGREFPPTRYT
jgi:hypothetical protein